MNSTTSENLDNISHSYNVWQPIVIIVLQVLGLGFSSIKYYLGNRNQTSLIDSIKKILTTSPNMPTEQVQLNIPDHLVSSIQKDKDVRNNFYSL